MILTRISQGAVLEPPDLHIKVVTSFLEQSGREATDLMNLRALVPGYSGASVYLVWIKNVPPVVLKIGPPAAITKEVTGRDSGYRSLPDLRAQKLDVTSEVIGLGGEARQCLAYFWEGGISFQEIRTRQDFGKYLNSYRYDARDRDALLYVVKDILASLRAGTISQSPGGAAFPMDFYLRKPDWSYVNNILGVAHGLAGQASGLLGLQDWYTEQTDAVRIAPEHDSRPLHGDLWFANVLVDRVRSQVNLIDYGNSFDGHIFQDLARFELDLLLHVDPDAPALTHEALRSRIRLACRSSLMSVEPYDPISVWREAVAEIRPSFCRTDVFEMYRWFLLNECLQRLRWVDLSELDESSSSYVPALLDLIVELRSALGGTNHAGPSFSSVANLADTLGVRDVYVPSGGTSLANWSRNDAKRLAIMQVPPGEHIRLVAESGHSYLSRRGFFAEEVARSLGRGVTLEVMVLTSDAFEKNLALQGDEPARDRARNKRRDSMVGLEFLVGHFPRQVTTFYSNHTFSATILLAGHHVFFEPYLPLSGSDRSRTLFDTFELHSSARPQSHLQAVLNAHWAALKAVALSEDGHVSAERN